MAEKAGSGNPGGGGPLGVGTQKPRLRATHESPRELPVWDAGPSGTGPQANPLAKHFKLGGRNQLGWRGKTHLAKSVFHLHLLTGTDCE